jgi:retron-type reverse transcriptase
MLMQGETRWSVPPLLVMPDSPLLQALASSILAGEAAAEKIIARLSRSLGRRWRWIGPLAQRYLKAFAARTRPRQSVVVEFLRHDRGFRSAWSKHGSEISIGHWLSEPMRMQPVAAAKRWNLPAIESIKDLAAFLALTPRELFWFADLKGLGYKQDPEKLHHYHYRALPKTNGDIRLIEAPKPRTKQLQQQILSGILEKVPTHPSAHGFVKGRSIKTFTAPHVGQRVVLRMDLKQFFPSFRAARIQTIFRTMGYPEPVADLLGGICTNCTPREVWNKYGLEADYDCRWQARVLYCRPHLPQGAPTSPALANLCTHRADCRLSGLAKTVGARYTRYADDLAFSGDSGFERGIERFSTHVAAILIEEGFHVHHRKTRVMRQGVRQHLAGVVVNRHLNIMRSDFDRLKATLTNCVRLGPESQNLDTHADFRSHLEGHINFVEMINPAKGNRLRRIFEQIEWN